METLATLTRHIVTYLVGMLVAWLAIYLSAADLKTATDAAHALVDPPGRARSRVPVQAAKQAAERG